MGARLHPEGSAGALTIVEARPANPGWILRFGEVPTREAAEMVNARKAEMPFLSSSMSEGFSMIVLNISGNIRIWTIRVVTEKYRPARTSNAITAYQ